MNQPIQNNDTAQSIQMAPRLHFVFPKQARLKKAFEPITEAAGFILSRDKERHAFGACVDTTGALDSIEASIKKPGVMFRKLNEGSANMAVIGLDKFIEESCRAKANDEAMNMRISAAFNCAACSMYIAASPETNINNPQDLSGKRIATSYPYSLTAWLEAQGVKDFTVIECDGDTEDEIRDGSADAIFEIVDSGQSLIDNNLERKIWAYNIQAVLIEHAGAQSANTAEAARIIRERLTEAADLSLSKPIGNQTSASKKFIEPAFLSLNAA